MLAARSAERASRGLPNSSCDQHDAAVADATANTALSSVDVRRGDAAEVGQAVRQDVLRKKSQVVLEISHLADFFPAGRHRTFAKRARLLRDLPVRLGVQTLACGEATVLSTRGPYATVVALR